MTDKQVNNIRQTLIAFGKRDVGTSMGLTPFQQSQYALADLTDLEAKLAEAEERLESEVVCVNCHIDLEAKLAKAEAERDALLAVVEAAKNAEDTVSNVIDCGDNVREFMGEDSDYLFIDAALAMALGDAIDTYDKAERVIRGE